MSCRPAAAPLGDRRRHFPKCLKKTRSTTELLDICELPQEGLVHAVADAQRKQPDGTFDGTFGGTFDETFDGTFDGTTWSAADTPPRSPPWPETGGSSMLRTAFGDTRPRAQTVS